MEDITKQISFLQLPDVTPWGAIEVRGRLTVSAGVRLARKYRNDDAAKERAREIVRAEIRFKLYGHCQQALSDLETAALHACRSSDHHNAVQAAIANLRKALLL